MQQPIPVSTLHENFAVSANLPFGHAVGVRPTHSPPATSHGVFGFPAEAEAAVATLAEGAGSADADAAGAADALGASVADGAAETDEEGVAEGVGSVVGAAGGAMSFASSSRK